MFGDLFVLLVVMGLIVDVVCCCFAWVLVFDLWLLLIVLVCVILVLIACLVV